MLFFSASFVSSQDLSKKISIVANEAPLEDIIHEIEEKGDVFFSYSSRAISSQQPISIDIQNKSVRHILKKVFLKNGINYSLVENQIVLKTAGEMISDPLLHADKSHYTISGYMKNKASGEVLIGAHVYEKNTYTGTSTNGYGFYSLTLPAGKHDIVFSFLGYATKEISLVLDKDMLINQEMKEAVLNIKEVEIVARAESPFFLDMQISEFRFNQKTLSKLPGITGDMDIIKSLQVVPGIESFGDGSTMFFVRGGSSDQNLILVDEVPVYNSSHLFGFISVISPDAISDMEVFKGDFPAKYGGRLSSVVDIKTKDGNMKQFGFSGNVGPYTSSISMEGPIVKNKSSFYVGGRISTLQWLPQLYYDDQEINVGFLDLNAKLNFKINDKNRLFATFYIGNDQLERKTNSSIETYGLSWYNILGTIRWNHVFNKKLFSNTTAFITRYQYLMYLSEDRREYWNSSISNISVKTDLSWFLNPNNTITAGLNISSHALDAGNINLNDEEGQEIPNYNCVEYDFYAGNEQKIGEKIILRYGLRLPIWQDQGPTTVYYFDEDYQVIDTFNAEKSAVYSSFVSLEPRMNITWLLKPGSSLKAGYSRTTQFLNQLSTNISPFTSLGVWVPAGPNIEPQKADQYSLGYFRGFLGQKLKFSAEAYYKQFYNYIDYAPHANLLYNPLIEGQIRSGDAYSYGLELMLRKPFGRLTGWIGYTYSRIFVQTPGVNNGEEYRAFQDRPNNFTLFVSYDTKKRWSFSANWILLSGAAISTPVSFYDYNGYTVPIYGEKNNDRLPVYHRLDLVVNYRLNKPENRYKHSLGLSLYNAYGRTNPYFISFNRIINDDEVFVIPSDHPTYYKRVSTELSVSEIIPSLNYQFSF
jgi:outer membrane cobalamin receptor